MAHRACAANSGYFFFLAALVFAFGLRLIIAKTAPTATAMMITTIAGISQLAVAEPDVPESMGWLLVCAFVGEVVSLGEPVVTVPGVGVG